ncbi:DUF4334 domain-containing protein [Mycolicibacterium frederiksbergense]|nr:DUF4334 domain-containing protein [Mycolicibacterium frederiksbergense]
MVVLQELFSTIPTTTSEALDIFDAAEAVEPDFMLDTWHGAELPTGHPMDGLLEASGWWGKQFVDAETVHPLLFPTGDGASLWALNPALAFGGLAVFTKLPLLRNRSMVAPIAALRPVLHTRAAKARLRTTRYRDVDTATMIYDQLPINDVFRRISDAAVIGAMDLRNSTKPYFFVLRRDNSMRLT